MIRKDDPDQTRPKSSGSVKKKNALKMQEERSSEFGLLHANLRSLEKAGRILILKHESFLDESEEVSQCSPFSSGSQQCCGS